MKLIRKIQNWNKLINFILYSRNRNIAGFSIITTTENYGLDLLIVITENDVVSGGDRKLVLTDTVCKSSSD